MKIDDVIVEVTIMKTRTKPEIGLALQTQETMTNANKNVPGPNGHRKRSAEMHKNIVSAL